MGLSSEEKEMINATERYLRAVDFVRREDLETGLERLSSLAKDPASHFMRGQIFDTIAGIYARQGDYTKAITFMKKSLQYSSQSPGGWTDLGELLLEAGRLREARNALHRAVSLLGREEARDHEPTANCWLRLGVASSAGGWLDTAERCLKRALSTAQMARDSQHHNGGSSDLSRLQALLEDLGAEAGTLEKHRRETRNALSYPDDVIAKATFFLAGVLLKKGRSVTEELGVDLQWLVNHAQKRKEDSLGYYATVAAAVVECAHRDMS